MKSVAELVGKRVRNKIAAEVKHNFVLPDTLMGVEVEVDRDSNSRDTVLPQNLQWWNAHHDGSLYNGEEYTLTHPMCGNALSVAITELFTGTRFFRTFTGSTHIHMDMLEEEVDVDVLRTLVLMVFALEPMLYASGDASREWCGYANSLKSASNLLISTIMNEESEAQFRRVFNRRNSEIGRYYGLNLVALNDYGSVEFRYFPTATSEEELVRWINLVQSFKKAAMAVGTTDNLRDIISDPDLFGRMMQEFFGDYEDEQRALGGWKSVYSHYCKALVVAQDSHLSPLVETGLAAGLASPMFSRLMPEVPEVGYRGSVHVHRDPAGSDGMPVMVGDLLHYNGRLYTRMAIPTAEHLSEWVPTDQVGSNTFLHPTTLDTIQRFLENEETSRQLTINARTLLLQWLSTRRAQEQGGLAIDITSPFFSEHDELSEDADDYDDDDSDY